MVARLTAAIVLLGLFGLGFVRLRWRHRALLSQQVFAEEFLSQLRTFVHSRGRDGEAYTWMTRRSNRMQSQMGSTGIAYHYRPPFANYMLSELPIILNMLPELQRWSALDRGIGGLSQQFFQYAATLQEALLRHEGILEDCLEESVSQLRNPFIWLRVGVQASLLLPLEIFRWLGVGGGATIARVSRNLLFRLVSALLAVVAFIASIVTILAGAEPAAQLVARLLGE